MVVITRWSYKRGGLKAWFHCSVGEWLEMESGGQKGGREEEGESGFLQHLSLTPPLSFSPALFSLRRPLYLNAWNRLRTLRQPFFLRMVNRSFRCKSFQYKLKQSNCTNILFTSNIVCESTNENLWVNIFVL